MCQGCKCSFCSRCFTTLTSFFSPFFFVTCIREEREEFIDFFSHLSIQNVLSIKFPLVYTLFCSSSKDLQLNIQTTQSPQTSVSSLSELSPSLSEGEENSAGSSSTQSTSSDLNENLVAGELKLSYETFSRQQHQQSIEPR